MEKQNTPILVRRKPDVRELPFDISKRNSHLCTLLHWHDHYEMEIVLDGNGTYSVNGEQYPLKRGSVYFVTPVDFHQVRGNLTLYNIAFDESLLSGEAMKLLIGGDFATVVHYDDEEFAFLELLATRLLAEFKEERPLSLQAE